MIGSKKSCKDSKKTLHITYQLYIVIVVVSRTSQQAGVCPSSYWF